MTAPYYADDHVTLYHGRAEDVLPTIAPDSVDVLLTDPPYFQVKDEEWDRQWKERDEFLTWLGQVLDAATSGLRPSASVWVFASPLLTSTVERDVVAPRFRLLNSIRWVKEAGWHQKAEIEAQRRYLTAWEGLLLAELREDAYETRDYLERMSIFQESGRYLERQRGAAGLTRVALGEVLTAAGVYASEESAVANISNQETGSKMLSPAAYEAWSTKVALKPYAELVADYDRLRARHSDARREYENLRRPFRLTRGGPVTDVWAFPPVMGYPGKHPCEKPIAMLDHMINTTSKPGGLILDPFAGSGSTLRAAKDIGRRAVGIEMDERWCEHAARRLTQEAFDFDGVA